MQVPFRQSPDPAPCFRFPPFLRNGLCGQQYCRARLDVLYDVARRRPFGRSAPVLNPPSLNRAPGRDSLTSLPDDQRPLALLGQVAPAEPDAKEQSMAIGTVKFFNTTKGFGFIAPEGGGKDVFVHASAVQAAGLRALNEGQRVSFDITPDARGSKATNLKAL